MKKIILSAIVLCTICIGLLSPSDSNAQTGTIGGPTTGGPSPTTPCYCNIGGYCESNGNMKICGYVPSGSTIPGYWCGGLTHACTTN